MTTRTAEPAEPPEARKPAGAAVLRPDKTDAIMAAFYTELADGGYDRLTMDRIAARAGVGKAALYRRWPSKERMFAELIDGLDGDHEPPPDHGNLADDLIAYVTGGINVLQDPLIRQIIPQLIARARSSPDLMLAVGRLPGPSREEGRAMFRRAIERGELAADTDIELALDLTASPVLIRGLFLDPSFAPGYPEGLAAVILRGIGYTPR
jgi:AcrR family transcriptional regulator